MRHDWFSHPKFRPLITCRLCGVIKQPDGENRPCPGKVRVELRDNRIAKQDRDHA